MNNVIVVTNLSYAVKINKPYVVNQSNVSASIFSLKTGPLSLVTYLSS